MYKQTLLGFLTSFVLGITSAMGALILDITNITSTQLTFNLTGSPVGTPSVSPESIFIEEASNADWILGPIGNTNFTTISASPIAGKPVDNLWVYNDHSNFEDILQMRFGIPTAVLGLDSGDSGTGTDVTITLPSGWMFDSAAVSILNLSWGVNGFFVL